MDWTRFFTVSGRTLSAAHFSISTGGMWLYMSRLSTDSGSKPRESMNCLQDQSRSDGPGLTESSSGFGYNRLGLTHSRVSFLPSILATTSRSSLAFSSLESQTEAVSHGGVPAGSRLGASVPVKGRGFVSSHGHQFGKQVWAGNAGIGGVDWESLDQRSA